MFLRNITFILPFSTWFSFLTALVLAGVQLIFSIVAGMKLWFGFLLETMLIIQGCFPYC